jgi:Flp pilus assembly protein TadD
VVEKKPPVIPRRRAVAMASTIAPPSGPAPATALALFNEGTRLQREGLRTEAADRYRRALAQDPTLIEAHNNLGVILLALGDPVEGERSLRAAIALDSRYGPAHANLGRSLLQQRRGREAEPILLRAAELMPANPGVQSNLALLYQSQGRQDEEAAAWQQVLALGSEDPAVHFNLGLYFERRRDPTAALRHYQMALGFAERLHGPVEATARAAIGRLTPQL